MSDKRPAPEWQSNKQRYRQKVDDGGQLLAWAVLLIIILVIVLVVLELLGVDTSALRGAG